jgi:hypothetical protein
MRNRTSLVFHLIALLVVASVPSQAQDVGVPPASVAPWEANLSIRLAVQQAVFETGHSLPVRVELQNCGQTDIWIALSYEQQFAFPVNLPLVIRDIHRRRVLPSTSWVHESPFGSGSSEWWVRLPPKYLYGRDFQLTQYESAFINTPGRYQITVSYTGIARPTSPSKPARSKPAREPANLPPEDANIFTGHVESNSIWVEVVGPSKSSH